MWSPLVRRQLSTTFYGLYFSHHITHNYQLQFHGDLRVHLPCTAFFTHVPDIWAEQRQQKQHVSIFASQINEKKRMNRSKTVVPLKRLALNGQTIKSTTKKCFVNCIRPFARDSLAVEPPPPYILFYILICLHKDSHFFRTKNHNLK